MAQEIFSKEELSRYSRHLIIPEFNIEGQRKLKAAKVLVVGTGGLGAPLLQYLAAAGVGTIGVLDFDVVEDSNLQRQVLFSTSDIGKPKVQAAKERLEGLNPYINIITHNVLLSSQNALEIVKDYDLVADGTDNFPTRYLVNDACVLSGKPNVYASIYRFDGQVSVFNYTDKDGVLGPNYRDLFPSPPPPGLVPSCAEGGVLGVLPGIIGSLQANEVIKVITGVGEPLVGRLFLFDAMNFETRTVKVYRDENNPVNGKNPTVTELIDYQEFCGFNMKQQDDIKSISVSEFLELQNSDEPFQLIDVREDFEYEISNIEGIHIPLADVEDEVDQIVSDKKVVVHCKAGGRSKKAIQLLEKDFGFTNLYNLTGGIDAYYEEVEAS
jgi:adenylyltransferase/sulfurtransferase